MYEKNEFILFPQYMGHKEVAKNTKPIAAGFCRIEKELINVAIKEKDFKDGSKEELAYFANQLIVSCYGESISLNLKSRNEEDSLIINRALRL